MTQVVNQTCLVKIFSKIECLELVVDKLYVFRVTNQKKLMEGVLPAPIPGANKPNNPKKETIVGFVNKENLDKLLNKSRYNTERLFVLPAEIRESIRIMGWRQTDLSTAKVFDWEGNPLPVAIFCDYVSGHFDNVRYNLKKTAAHLLTRDDITLYSNVQNSSIASSIVEAILDIPYYNQDEGKRDQFLAFRWAPSVEGYRRAWDHESKSKYRDMHKAIFDLDIFVLRAIGAARFGSYYGG